MSEAYQKPAYDTLVKKIVNRYAEEIVGGFKVKTFKFSRKFLRNLFNRLLNAAAGRNQRRIWGTDHDLSSRLRVHGQVEQMRALSEIGTVVVVPTHSSNLDSILIGYALDQLAGMPGFIYGAGLNLYDSEFFSYFMNRLGAYRVDRRKKNPLYLESLKSMSTLAIARGVHSIFFTGGTRSRSGSIEQNLKMGLLGTAVEAQRLIYQKGKNKKVFIVPLVLSYHCVLEANYLIDQFLKRTGKEKYFRSKDEFKSIPSILKFLWRIFNSGSDILLNFGAPLDVLGNKVDINGNSIGVQNPLDVIEYFSGSNGVEVNKQREQIYTQNLAREIAAQYLDENIVLSSHLVSHCAFKILQEDFSAMDVFELVRHPEEEYVFDEERLLKYISRAQYVLTELEREGKAKCANIISESSEKLLEQGLNKSGVFHSKRPILRDKKGDIVSEDFKLLYFYHNRLDGYPLLHKQDLVPQV